MNPAGRNLTADIQALYRTESRRIFAALVRLLDDGALAGADEQLPMPVRPAQG